MKTSLIIDDRVFKLAEREARKLGVSISQVISDWARLGLSRSLENRSSKKPKLKPVDLGSAPLMDLTSRRDWLDGLD